VGTLDSQVLSASSVATFLRCGRQWEFAYAYAIKSPPTLRLVIGNAAHEAVETNYRQKMDTGLDLPIDDVKDAFSTAFDRLATEVEHDDDEDEDESPKQSKDSGIVLVGNYQHQVAPTIQPVIVEEQIQFRVNEIPFSGYIDLVDQHRQVRDLKTTKRKPQRNDYLISMIGYAIGFRQATGEVERNVILDYMVRTKQPYYHPVPSEGPVPDSAIRQFAKIVESVATAISKGSFIPTGLTNNACSWCGYKRICPDYQGTHG
jgi:hypothetical protein